MLKISWSIKSDKHSNYFAICDHESAFQLWWSLTNYGLNDGAKPINIAVSNLNGDTIDTSNGWREVVSQATFTRPAN